MQQIRRRLTYANVMSSLAVFLVLGGATAFAASQLGKNSVGTKQLKANAVTTAKLKANAVTTAKLKANAVTSAKIKDGAVTGAKVNAGTLGTVPNSAATNVIKTSKGTVPLGGEATALEYGPLKISVKCITYAATEVAAVAIISSSTDSSVFTSWEDGSKTLGPATPVEEREINRPEWNNSSGPFEYDSPSDGGVSALASNGQGFNAYVGLASEKDTNTCWYFLNATILG